VHLRRGDALVGETAPKRLMAIGRHCNLVEILKCPTECVMARIRVGSAISLPLPASQSAYAAIDTPMTSASAFRAMRWLSLRVRTYVWMPVLTKS